MYLLEITKARELAVFILGELSPNMTFLYDLFAFIISFVVFISLVSPFIYMFRKFSRW